MPEISKVEVHTLDRDKDDAPKTPTAKVELKEAVTLTDPPSEEPELSERAKIAQKYSAKRGANQEKEGEINAKTVDNPTGSAKIKDNSPEMIPIKVLGREILVEKERVDKAGGVVAYQKEVAVNQGFKDLAEQRRAAEEREAYLARKEAELKAKEQAIAAKSPSQKDENKLDPPSPGDQSFDVKAKTLTKAIYDGTEEELEQAVKEILAFGNKPQQQLNPDELVNSASERTMKLIEERKRDKEVHDARIKIFADHPELKTDPLLFQAVDYETTIVMREHPEYAPAQILSESYDRVSKWRGNMNAQGSLETKAEEKRSMNRPPVSTGRVTTPPPPRPQTKSEYVEQERKRRGLE